MQFSRCTALISGSFSCFHPYLPLIPIPCVSHWMIFCFSSCAFIFKNQYQKFRTVSPFSCQYARLFHSVWTRSPSRIHGVHQPASLKPAFIIFSALPILKIKIENSLYIIWPWKCLVLSSCLFQNDLHLAIITAPHYNIYWPAARTGGKVQCLSIMMSSAFFSWSKSPNIFWINSLGLFCLNSFFIP